MGKPAEITGNELASSLHELGVHFIMADEKSDGILQDQPARLIGALSESREARLRLSLIPLFLGHPEFAVHVRAVASSLLPPARLTLQCYYSAAIWLGQKYRARLNILVGEKTSLPDVFSHELGLHTMEDPQNNLVQLAKRHQVLSGEQVNWLGTYLHALQIWIKCLELQGA